VRLTFIVTDLVRDLRHARPSQATDFTTKLAAINKTWTDTYILVGVGAAYSSESWHESASENSLISLLF